MSEYLCGMLSSSARFLACSEACWLGAEGIGSWFHETHTYALRCAHTARMAEHTCMRVVPCSGEMLCQTLPPVHQCTQELADANKMWQKMMPR